MEINDETADSERQTALRRLLDTHTRPVVLDVGANEGQFAADILEMVIPEIYCFEPIAEASRRLSENFGSRESVHVITSAVDEVAGEAKMFVTESSVGASLLEPVQGQKSKWATTIGRQTTRKIRLDEFIQDQQIHGF